VNLPKDVFKEGGSGTSLALFWISVDIPLYRPRYQYFIQNDTISIKFYRISFWTDMSGYIVTWPICQSISEMNISDISSRDAFDELLQTDLMSFYKR